MINFSFLGKVYIGLRMVLGYQPLVKFNVTQIQCRMIVTRVRPNTGYWSYPDTRYPAIFNAGYPVIRQFVGYWTLAKYTADTGHPALEISWISGIRLKEYPALPKICNISKIINRSFILPCRPRIPHFESLYISGWGRSCGYRRIFRPHVGKI